MEKGVGMPMGKTKERGLRLRGQSFLSSQLGTVWSCMGLSGLGQREGWASAPRALDSTEVRCRAPPWGCCGPGSVCSPTAMALLGCV